LTDDSFYTGILYRNPRRPEHSQVPVQNLRASDLSAAFEVGDRDLLNRREAPVIV